MQRQSTTYLISLIVRYYGTQLHNYVGTCKMGSDDDPLAVVDNELKGLGGVAGLRVIDANITPVAPRANTNAVGLFAEEVADIIKEENIAYALIS